MKPLRDMFHIKRIIEEETKSGIYTGDMAANGKRAIILAVNGSEKVLKVGDEILVDARFMQEIDNDEYLIKAMHILGKVLDEQENQ